MSADVDACVKGMPFGMPMISPLKTRAPQVPRRRDPLIGDLEALGKHGHFGSFAVGAYGLPLAKAGEAVTDAFLRVRSHPRMFALGDAAYVTDSKGQKLPATAQVHVAGFRLSPWSPKKCTVFTLLWV